MQCMLLEISQQRQGQDLALRHHKCHCGVHGWKGREERDKGRARESVQAGETGQ